MIQVSQLYIYPVKSLGGIPVSSARLTDRGFEHDRRWLLVDEEDRFITQRECPQMALLQTAITEEGLVVFRKNNTHERILIPFSISTHDRRTVKIWNDRCEAVTISNQINEWFSDILQTPCKLVFMPDDVLRKVDMRYAVHPTDITNFSDGYPLLVISQASLDDLNSRLESPLPVDRFRPNIVITGAGPYEEDEMEEFIIRDMNFYGVKLCSRCVITTINQESLVKGKEPLKTLAAYRVINNNIYFGQNLLYNKTGVIKTEDQVRVTRRKAKPVFQHLPAV